MKASKIIRLEAENVKRLRAVRIEPDGAVVVVSGRNAQGKSSVLDAIWMALGGRKAIPRRPVREGAEEARIRLELEDLVVERKIKPDGSTQLYVSSPEGARYPSPQAMLDKLVGSLSFDPLAFARMDPKRQRELLRELVGLDTSSIDAERARLFDERTAVNRDVRRLEAEHASTPHHDDAPAAEVSVAELSDELRAADAAHGRTLEAEQRVRKCELALGTAEEHAQALRTRIEAMRAELAQLETRLAEGEKNVIPRRRAELDEARTEHERLVGEEPDRKAILARIGEAETINQRVRANRRREELAKKHEEARAWANDLTRQIEACDAKKASLVAGAAYPLEGLAVDEHGVTLGGMPLEQASSAEQLRVSVAIGLALHPQLRVLLVRDGSLLDADSMRLLGELAAEADAQVWLERVGAESAIGVVIEDGAVVGAATEAAE